MASSKVMRSSNSRNSDLSRRASSTKTLYDNTQPFQSTLLDAQITLINTPIAAVNAVSESTAVGSVSQQMVEYVLGETMEGEMKEEAANHEMMTLEDFLAKASGDVAVEEEVKVQPAELIGGGELFCFDPVTPSRFVQPVDQLERSTVVYNGGEVVGRRRRGRDRGMLELMDKAAEQRQRRMIKNRESAARSRERKQAHQNELECLAARLVEENMELKKEKAEKTRKRLQQLKDDIIPIEEKRKPKKELRRTHSWTCTLSV